MTRKTMVLLSALIIALVLGDAAVTGAEPTYSSWRTSNPEPAALPWSFGGVWEMDLRCSTMGDSKHPGTTETASHRARDARSAMVPGRLDRDHEPIGRPPRWSAPLDQATEARRQAMAASHHAGGIAIGSRFVLETLPWSSADHLRVRLAASADGDALAAGWTGAGLRIAGAIPLREEIPCDAAADAIISNIQQQDLLRVEGNVCLDGGDGECHDHFVVIVARRRGTLGPTDDGQLVIFAIDAGGQYTTGHRIRSLSDAASYGGRMLRHLGASHSHDGTGGN